MKILKIIKSILRILGLLTAVFVVLFIALSICMTTGKAEPADKVNFGVTYSKLFTEQMGLDWQEAYLAILDDLGVKKIRLVAYWHEIEKEQGQYLFDDLDWQIEEAEKRGAEIILVMGRRLPRWPECHIPEWAKGLDEAGQQKKILDIIEKIINRYKEKDIIWAWQVENEPFLKNFGECPKLDIKFLEKEVDLVRKLDTKARPIIMTTSGELSSWLQAASRGDVLGTTLYRVIYNDYVGYFEYPLPPVFYHKRAQFVKKITGIEKVIIIELQAEPWGPKLLFETSQKEQAKSMDIERFRNTINYTYQTGYDEAYLWGAEWWYWMKETHDNDAFWQEAKKLWQTSVF